jgi:protein ImuB
MNAHTWVGVADGPFAATQAARLDRVVGVGESAAFLAPMSIDVLDEPELVDVLRRLGITTLGAYAALPAPDVLARFGALGLATHRLASGLDERPPSTQPPPDDLTVAAELDPPAERVEAAAFVARGLADQLHQRLGALGSSCTRLLVGAETEHGERHERLWRSEGAGAAQPLTPGAVADRVRWQLDGWLNGTSAQRPTAGITRIWLTPDEVGSARGRLLGFWGSDPAAADRAVRAVTRAQGLLGIDAIAVPERRGGRSPAEAVGLVPAAAVDLTDRNDHATDAPWPGRVPDPSPATVHPEPISVDVLDARGRRVAVSGRGEPSAPPAHLVFDGERPHAVVAWAGPWPVDERWWDPDAHRRRARFQIVTTDSTARLLAVEGGRWWLEATYD